MRQTVIIFIAAVLFLLLFGYITQNLSPWNQTEVKSAILNYNLKSDDEFNLFIQDALNYGQISRFLDARNILIWVIVLGVSVVLAFAAVHLFLDKLFFRKFYEKPSMLYAVRRGIIFYLFLVGLIALRFISGLFWYNALALAVLGVALEYLFLHTGASRNSDHNNLKTNNHE